MKKICRICCETKNILNFTRNKNADDGYNYMCKICCSEYRHYLSSKKKIDSLKAKKDLIQEQNLFDVSFF